MEQKEITYIEMVSQKPKETTIFEANKGVKLTKEILPDNKFWLEQNPNTKSIFAELARSNRKVKWLFDERGEFYGPVCVDGIVYNTKESAIRLLNP